MSKYILCPYCIQEVEELGEVIHTDTEIYNKTKCGSCDKFFKTVSELITNYESYVSPCMNEGNHKFVVLSSSVEGIYMKCVYCEEVKFTGLDKLTYLARECFKESVLRIDKLTEYSFIELCGFIQTEITSLSKDPENFIIPGLAVTNVVIDGDTISLRVSANHFEDRQGITFEKTGWVGFGGSFDDYNKRALVQGFLKWVIYTSGLRPRRIF